MEYLGYNFNLDKETFWGTEKLGRFDIFFPQADLKDRTVMSSDIPKYLKVTIGSKHYYLKTTVKEDRRSHVYVSTAVYNGSVTGNFTLEKSSEARFLIYRMQVDKNQRIAFEGLILACIGVFIDATFAIGKAGYVKWEWNVQQVFYWMLFTMALKIAGLLLVYYKGLREAK